MFGFVTFLISLIPEVESKGGGSGSRPGGGRPGVVRPVKPPYTPYKPKSSSKSFGPKKVVAFAAGAYVGGKVAQKVTVNFILEKSMICIKKITQDIKNLYIAHFINFKIGKKFKKGFIPDDDNYGFNEWNRDAQIDGWVCRNDEDCDWIDDHLGCDDRSFSSAGLNVNFFIFIGHYG